MFLDRLGLVHFRNFTWVEEVKLPRQGLLLAAAANATGKTNFLESVVMLLRGKSWRAQTEHCIQWGKEGFLIRGEVNTGNASSVVSLQYSSKPKSLRLEENESPASLVTFYTRYPAVLFLPEDTFMFSRGPEVRRNFLNSVLISVPAYMAALVQYTRALKQRNLALKNTAGQTQVEAWNVPLAEQAAIVWRHRQALTSFIATHLATRYEQFAGETKDFKVRLQTSVASENYQPALHQSFGAEKRYGHTIHGPHRDDLVITVGDKPVRLVLSQGQMRSLVVALKIVVADFLRTVTQQEPVLLFDEALSELDADRQRRFLENLPDSQVLLTTTSVPASLRGQSHVHYLDLKKILISKNES